MKKIMIGLVASLGIIGSIQASTLEQYINAGNSLWSEGKLSEAELQFNKALEINPDSSTAYARMANLYLTQNKTTEAVEAFQNAISHDPENANLFIGLAITYLHQRYYQMSEAMVNHAIELDPEMANAQKLKAYLDAKKESVASIQKTESVNSAPVQH